MLLGFCQGFSQNPLYNVTGFKVKGLVIESDTRDPIPNVNVETITGGYTTTDSSGRFEIEARVGDELIIRYKDFETVYHTVKNDDRIILEVEPEDNADKISKRGEKLQSLPFEALIDSAKVYLKKDVERSIQFVTDALAESRSSKQNAEAYEVLADINMFWKQFDLGVSNYRISLQNKEKTAVKLKLANAYHLNKNYQESISAYKDIELRRLSNFEQVELLESLGDIYLLTKDFNASETAYNKALTLAKKHLITPKITNLNSKLAEVYSASGFKKEAEVQFNRSLNLANQENKKRAVEEKVKVADFQNDVNNFQYEIKLRKEALNDMEEIEEETDIDNKSALTKQRQNYKIGTAYALTRDFDSAIPYLEKSIKEANIKEDLIVEKDATRKLSEVFRDAGEFDKALTAYQSYVELVDKLYIKKEQEIALSARRNRDIVNKQNRILSLESDRALAESNYQLSTEQAKRQKIAIYSLIGGLVLLLLMAFFMYKYIRQQRLANNLLALKSLRSQMNPHFIFNALNSVNSYVASNDERSANKYLTDFSLLMRAVLENSEKDFIPLEKELELIELYTRLEHSRFKNKFDYTITVDDTIKISDFEIPPMLLQPYIENAVWHGLRYKKTKGKLEIALKKIDESTIIISITDNGIGREQSKALKTANQKKQRSKGMGNIKKRVAILNDMYKDKVDVNIADLTQDLDAGTKVIVTLKKD